MRDEAAFDHGYIGDCNHSGFLGKKPLCAERVVQRNNAPLDYSFLKI